jgi:hypothetical protein
MTVFQSAAYNMYVDILLKVYEMAQEELTKEDINDKVLLDKNNKGKTVFHNATYNRNIDIF